MAVGECFLKLLQPIPLRLYGFALRPRHMRWRKLFQLYQLFRPLNLDLDER